MIRRPPRSTQSRSSAASDVYKRQDDKCATKSPRTPIPFPDFPPFHKVPLVSDNFAMPNDFLPPNTLVISFLTAIPFAVVDHSQKEAFLKRRMDSRIREEHPSH